MNWDDIIIDAAATDTGMRRANNQDSFTSVRSTHAAAWRSRGHVFMVADGMGAHAVGELASKMACDLIPHTYLKARAGTPSEAITKAFREVRLACPISRQQGLGQSRLSGHGNDVLVAHLASGRGAHRARGRLSGLPGTGKPRRSVLVRP